jgi:hypothetical protein
MFSVFLFGLASNRCQHWQRYFFRSKKMGKKLDYNCYEFSQKYLNFIITSQSLSVKEKFKHIDDWFERKLNAPAAYQDIVLYHCTLSENDILGEGFKPPINENKNFFNSRTGHVYFSLNPGIALDVAFIAFKKLNGLSVYKASIPVNQKKKCM